MRLLPGTKLSEAEIAGMFDVSRQPVRDAFSRLENNDLLLIRPQKRTEVKRFSLRAIKTARFVRASVEAEVLRRASRLCGPAGADSLDKQLAEQQVAVDENNYERFRELDYHFHKTFCDLGEVEFAAEVIADNKAQVDRLCVLELTGEKKLETLLDDHRQIAHAVTHNDCATAVETGMRHLSRLDATINAIRDEHTDYFDD